MQIFRERVPRASRTKIPKIRQKILAQRYAQKIRTSVVQNQRLHVVGIAHVHGGWEWLSTSSGLLVLDDDFSNDDRLRE